jgi:hypothetical protein
MGTLGQGYTQGGIFQTVQNDVFYYWTEHGKATIPHGDKWHAPTGLITANTQVTERIQERLDGPVLPKYATFITDDIFAVTADPTKIRDNRFAQTSLISEQIKDSIFPSTNQPGTGTKEWIQTHGSADVIKPGPFENPHGGTPIITSVYKDPPGRNQAFQKQPDNTWFPIRFGGTSQGDKNWMGSSLAGMKKRGLIS